MRLQIPQKAFKLARRLSQSAFFLAATFCFTHSHGQTEARQNENQYSDPIGGSMCVAGNYLYVVTSRDGLQILDVSDPTQPRWAGAWTKEPCPIGIPCHPYYPHGVYVVGNYAYVANGLYGLEVLDVHDPCNPVRVATVNVNAAVSEVLVEGERGYLHVRPYDDSSEWKLVDIKNPTNPRLVGDYKPLAHTNKAYRQSESTANVAVVGPHIYLQGSKHRAIDTLFKEGALSNMGLPSFQIVGNFAYVIPVVGPEDLKVFDVSDPDKLKLIGTYRGDFSKHEHIFEQLRVAGQHVYILLPFDRILVLDLSNPTKPRAIGRFDRHSFASRCISLNSTDESASATRLKETSVPRTSGIRPSDKDEPPKLVNPHRLADGTFAFTIVGLANETCLVQMSSNLSQWMSFSTNTLTQDGQAIIEDPSAKQVDQRYYRAVKQ